MRGFKALTISLDISKCSNYALVSVTWTSDTHYSPTYSGKDILGKLIMGMQQLSVGLTMLWQIAYGAYMYIVYGKDCRQGLKLLIYHPKF